MTTWGLALFLDAAIRHVSTVTGEGNVLPVTKSSLCADSVLGEMRMSPTKNSQAVRLPGNATLSMKCRSDDRCCR
ncbi:protein of unknown function [Hyphomicrobium sp. MC1]|nr:protein of unknown function [Hyphomicrobium sp. MC1]